MILDESIQTKSQTNYKSADDEDASFVQSAPRGTKRPFVDNSTSSSNDPHSLAMIQYLHCVVRLVSSDFDHKPRNY